MKLLKGKRIRKSRASHTYQTARVTSTKSEVQVLFGAAGAVLVLPKIDYYYDAFVSYCTQLKRKIRAQFTLT